MPRPTRSQDEFDVVVWRGAYTVHRRAGYCARLKRRMRRRERYQARAAVRGA